MILSANHCGKPQTITTKKKQLRQPQQPLLHLISGWFLSKRILIGSVKNGWLFHFPIYLNSSRILHNSNLLSKFCACAPSANEYCDIFITTITERNNKDQSAQTTLDRTKAHFRKGRLKMKMRVSEWNATNITKIMCWKIIQKNAMNK